MRKKINILVVALLVFLNALIIPTYKANADVKKSYSTEIVSELTVKAEISDLQNFKGEIDLIIKDGKGMKRIFALNSDNNYTCTYSLPIGDCEFGSIKIYESSDSDKSREAISLPYTYDGDLKVVDGKTSIFTINVDNISESNVSTENQEAVEENVEDSSNQGEVEVKEKNNVSDQFAFRNGINLILDAVLIVCVGSIALYLKYKDKNKNE